MLDYNHKPKFADRVNAVVDERLASENAARQPRAYLGGSRLGHACERALQFEFAGAPKDEGSEFSGRTLRIFGIGHALEDLAVCWLRGAGFDLYTRKGNRPDGDQFGFSVAGGRIRGHVDGIIAAAPEALDLSVPALWECKTMNARNWRRPSTRAWWWQSPSMRRRSHFIRPTWTRAFPGSRPTRLCSQRSTRTLLSFTMSSCRSTPLWRNV